MVVKLFLPFNIDDIQCHFSKQYVELQGTLKGLEFKAVLTQSIVVQVDKLRGLILEQG